MYAPHDAIAVRPALNRLAAHLPEAHLVHRAAGVLADLEADTVFERQHRHRRRTRWDAGGDVDQGPGAGDDWRHGAELPYLSQGDGAEAHRRHDTRRRNAPFEGGADTDPGGLHDLSPVALVVR